MRSGFCVRFAPTCCSPDFRRKPPGLRSSTVGLGLHLRERVLPGVQRAIAKGKAAKVVLFVHGGFSPATVAYDLEYKDFSWMEYLARAGFDVFALTHTAYGYSPKPYMDDPCNVDPKQQAILIPHVLKAPCAPPPCRARATP